LKDTYSERDLEAAILARVGKVPSGVGDRLRVHRPPEADDHWESGFLSRPIVLPPAP